MNQGGSSSAGSTQPASPDKPENSNESPDDSPHESSNNEQDNNSCENP